jgi:hypothetical protein
MLKRVLFFALLLTNLNFKAHSMATEKVTEKVKISVKKDYIGGKTVRF